MSFIPAVTTKSPRNPHLPSRRRPHPAIVCAFEPLEIRCLLSGITSYALDPAALPYGIIHDASGAVWYADPQQGAVVKVTLDANQEPIYASYPVDGVPTFITYNAADGDLYVATGLSITQLNTDGDVLNSWTVVAASDRNFATVPVELTVGGDGAIWYTTRGAPHFDVGTQAYDSNALDNFIGRLNPNGGATDLYQLTVTDSQTFGITTDPSGNVWFTMTPITSQSGNPNVNWIGSAHLGRIAVDAGNQIDIFAVPTFQGSLSDIRAAADGSLWYLSADEVGDPRFATEPTPDLLAHVTYNPASGGSVAITEYQIPKLADQAGVLPASLEIDASGKIWFTEFLDAKISNFDPLTASFNRYNVPGTKPGYMTISGSSIWVTSPFSQTPEGDPAPALIRIDLGTVSSSIASTLHNIEATPGQHVTGPLVTFTSQAAGDFVYTIDYGNGQTASGTIANDISGQYTINADVTYAAAGTYTPRIIIADSTGETITLLASALIANPVTPGLGLAQGTVIHTKLFLLLASSDDVGTYFNITVEMLDKNGHVIATGTKSHDKVNPVTNNTINPLDFSTDIAMTVLADTSFNLGDYFSLRVAANIDPAGHGSGTLALQYDAVIRSAQFTMDYGNGAKTFYLHSEFDNSTAARDSAQLDGLAPLNFTRVMDTTGNSIATGGTLNDTVVNTLKALCRLSGGDPLVTLGSWSGVIV